MKLTISTRHMARVAEHCQQAYPNEGCGILIAPNHPSHADPFTYYEAMDHVPSAAFFMATWHVFDSRGVFGQWALQKIGVFSVDREGADLQALCGVETKSPEVKR